MAEAGGFEEVDGHGDGFGFVAQAHGAKLFLDVTGENFVAVTFEEAAAFVAFVVLTAEFVECVGGVAAAVADAAPVAVHGDGDGDLVVECVFSGERLGSDGEACCLG